MSSTVKPRSSRPRGRPGPSATSDVRELILSASERLFALQGFSATTIRQIADEVNVNPAMVHYYFGSKSALLEAVMVSVLEPLAGSIASLGKTSEFKLQDFTTLLFGMLAKHPHMPQLITREVFLPGGVLQEGFLGKFAPRLGGRLPGILEQQKKAGLVRTDLDTDITALLILALCFFPFIAKPAAEIALGVRLDEPGMRRLSRHVTSVLERGIMS